MKYLLLLCLIPLSAYAGSDELNRDLAVAKVHFNAMAHHCQHKPVKEAQDCLRQLNESYARVVRDIRQSHARCQTHPNSAKGFNCEDKS